MQKWVILLLCALSASSEQSGILARYQYTFDASERCITWATNDTWGFRRNLPELWRTCLDFCTEQRETGKLRRCGCYEFRGKPTWCQ